MFRDLLPLIIKLKDSETTPEILQEYVDILEDEYDTQEQLIRDLSKLTNLDETPYRAYLMDLVHGDGFDALDIADWIVKNIVYIHKIKGTQQSWRKYWYWLIDQSNIDIIELYKTTQYETTDWDLKDSAHPLKSNKIEFCLQYCETYGETDVINEDFYFEMIEDISPVHVRLRPDVIEVEFDDTAEAPYGTLGCPRCETGCETDCEVTAETWEGSAIEGSFREEFTGINDSFNAITNCINLCETSCEDCCESACECEPCELYCESGCESRQTHGSGGGSACETQQETLGACATSCVSVCQTVCQFDCEIGCECQCTTDCDAAYCQAGSCQGCVELSGGGP